MASSNAQDFAVDGLGCSGCGVATAQTLTDEEFMLFPDDGHDTGILEADINHAGGQEPGLGDLVLNLWVRIDEYLLLLSQPDQQLAIPC